VAQVTSQFKRDIGFVDQHDFLLPTMYDPHVAPANDKLMKEQK
jgi:hypothetical protein